MLNYNGSLEESDIILAMERTKELYNGYSFLGSDIDYEKLYTPQYIQLFCIKYKSLKQYLNTSIYSDQICKFVDDNQHLIDNNIKLATISPDYRRNLF